MRNAYTILFGKGRLRRLRRRWVDNIKINHKGREREGVDSVNLAHDRDQ
jgi:hypothetical protein